MIEFFQITGSASFAAARIALEEAGAEYAAVNIHPRRATSPRASPRSIRSSAFRRCARATCRLRDRCGAALAGRPLPEQRARAGRGRSRAGRLYRWILWLADTLHPAWWPIMKSPGDRPRGGRARRDPRARPRAMDAHGAYLERELARGPWCLGDTFSVADMYLYMLVGWESYIPGGYSSAASACASTTGVSASGRRSCARASWTISTSVSSATTRSTCAAGRSDGRVGAIVADAIHHATAHPLEPLAPGELERAAGWCASDSRRRASSRSVCTSREGGLPGLARRRPAARTLRARDRRRSRALRA